MAEILVHKSVEVNNKTSRGHTIRVNGGKGMFSLVVAKNKSVLNSDKREEWFYTDELDALIDTLTAFRDTMQAKQEV